MEAILPLDSFYAHLDEKLDSAMGGNIIINMGEVNVNNGMDVNELVENLAFQVQRKMGFR